MKKIIILLSAAALFLGACQSAPKAPEEVFEPTLKSPKIEIGAVEIQFDRTFPLPGLRKLPVTLFYYPVEDAVCLQWRMDMMTYYQFWSYSGRDAFIKNLEKYKADFENRNFGKSSRRSRRVYGSSNGYIIWQMSALTLQAKVANTVRFGYYFVDKVPYYVAFQEQVEYKDDITRTNDRVLQEIPMYFTRAQADALAEFFDPEFIASIVISPHAYIEAEPDVDEYYIDEQYAEEQDVDEY